MSTTTVSTTPHERLRLLRMLPRENMGLREARATRRLRAKVLTDEEKETLGFNEKSGRIEDLDQITELEKRDLELTEDQANVIVEAIVKKDDEGAFPNDDAFWTFVEAFEEKIEDRIED